MAVAAETIEKMNRLDERSTTIVVDLVDFLSDAAHKKEQINVFRAAREEGKKIQ